VRPLFRAALLAGVTAVTVGGCVTPLLPSDVDGTYVLQRVGGIDMPATIPVPGGGSFQMVYDTVVLYADRRSYVAREISGVPPSSGVAGEVGEGTFEMDESTIILSPPSCGGLVCNVSATRRLRRRNGGLVENDAFLGVMEFARVGPALP
jgi:hypothetical protein